MNQSIFRSFKRLQEVLAPVSEEPIRSELFSIERLEQHAATLAAAQAVKPDPVAGRPLVARLKDNGRVLLQAYRAIADAISEKQVITPAAEWLVDNFHIVDEQIREIQDDLPRGYYRILPKLAEGPLEGYPRVFGIAWAFVAHTDSRFDLETLSRFVGAYQRVQPLAIGELWAVAITLRIVMVENLRRAAESIVSSRRERQEADAVADRLLGVGRAQAESPDLALRVYSGRRLPRTFAVQLIQRLRDQDPAVTPALRWLDERLTVQGTNSETIVREEHQFQGAISVTVRNIITSMRLMSSVDWRKFFESVSLADALLRAKSNFASMDFSTRDSYRHAIEALARRSAYTELEVTERAIALAAAHGEQHEPEGDPGYWLISRGRPAFEKQLAFRLPFRTRMDRAAIAAGMPGYLGVIALVSVSLLAVPIAAAAASGAGATLLVVLALLAAIPSSDAALALVNHWITHRFGPKPLPALDLHDGVPDDLRTMVVMPTLLTSREEIETQIERLEVHYLANQDGELYFALVSDWRDAAVECADGDDDLLGAAAEGIARLNQRYEPGTRGERFLLLHRKRVWNASEKKWMGWERKRGKLHELNRLLRGADDTTFLHSESGPAPGSSRVPAQVRYVITLDADTRFPRRAARRLVGKMAHPLNRPKLDPRSRRVTEGYGVLQPRVTPSLPTGRAGSFFQHIFSGPGGIDPYAFAVSDVYQDLFNEGSYSGKGIYDVDVFESALAGRFPDNTVLSHDLLEGIFAGAGLVSDIEVVEEFPTRYDVAAARQHRWTRGDWQLLPWIFGKGARTDKIPHVGRWKMIDNLRRSLSTPAAFCALVAAWSIAPPDIAAMWTAFILGAIALPPLLPFFTGIIPRRRSKFSKRSHIRAVMKDLALAFSQIGFNVSLLAHQAWLMTDAIARTLYRLFVSRRKMLEWITAAQAQFGLPLTIPGFYIRMAGGAALSCAAALIVVVFAPPAAWLVAAPFIVLWISSPLVAQRVSRPRAYAGPAPVSESDAHALRLIARRTWRYFETFVTSTDNALPPDNFQEDPRPAVAHRTSPTNIGLYLLSAISANDFGWTGMYETMERLDATFTTLLRLERFRGHFYNWYDTRDLRPLDPKYISSVDSGNLAGHLIAAGNACVELIRRPVMDTMWTGGIADALQLTSDALHALSHDRRAQMVSRKRLEEELETVSALLSAPADTPAAVVVKLKDLAAHALVMADIARTLIEEGRDAPASTWGSEVIYWTEAVRASIASHERDAELLNPWSLLDAAVMRDPQIFPDAIVGLLDEPLPALETISARCEDAASRLTFHLMDLRALGIVQGGASAGAEAVTGSLIDSFDRTGRLARSLERRFLVLKENAVRMFAAMEFGFLFDEERRLLSIGYRVTDGVLDPSCYDLLASEARLASFVAIAKGDVPVRNWFALGRSLTPVDRGSALISWSGSMFEYLMPALVMRVPPESLLGQTKLFVVRRQMEYGRELGVPWGVSESAYNVRDLELTYQYSNFGVPGLGLKRGLSKDAVIAPYATGLAAMIDPAAAAENYAHLARAGGCGTYGFYEAMDYTPSRLPEGEPVAVVRAYMAHHQGMTLTAIGNVLHDGVMQGRFHSEPIVQATELLLQERTPRDVAVARPRAEEVNAAPAVRDPLPSMYRRFHSPHERLPRTHILSNGNYAVMVTGAGSGYSRWRDLSITRWREDVTADAWGSYIYLRDVRSQDVWSAGYQPTCVEPDTYEVEFSEDRVEIVRHDGQISATLEITVSPEDNAEVRRISLSNLGNRTRVIELTSYAEIVLAQPSADSAHAAFSKLFVQTEFVDDVGSLLATRRRRSSGDPEIWAAHCAVIEGTSEGRIQYETDRARFLGRGRDVRLPISVMDGKPLSNTVGTVLDPVFSLRCRVRIAPGSTARVAFWTMVAPSRTAVLDLADKHRDPTAFERAGTLAWTQAQVELHHLGISAEEAHLFQHLANHVLYSNPALRPPSDLLRRNTQGQSALWAHRISGDLPIVLVRIDEPEDLDIVRQLLRAHEYWRMKLLAVDLVILNERPQSYNMDLQSVIETVVRTNESQVRPQATGKPALGSIYIVRADLVSMDVRLLLQSTARVVLLSRRGSLAEQLASLKEFDSGMPPPLQRRAVTSLTPTEWVKDKFMSPRAEDAGRPTASGVHSLEFSNGFGGFTDDGKEYVTILKEGQSTPAPWINVVANRSFGFHVSADGAGYTWSLNSRENKLTPWSNDPVSDTPGEVFYIRDEHSGAVWSPTALPIRETAGLYTARHGQGYSRFEYASQGISSDLLQFVPLDDPIKISRLTVKNTSRRNRRLSLTAYVEWVLAASREASLPFVSTEIDPVTGAMFARNPWRTEFNTRVAFADCAGRQMSWTGDRKEFLGRNCALDYPAALAAGAPLSNRVGAGLDPCCAMQIRIELRPDEQTEITFLLGEAAASDEAQRLITRYRTLDLDAVFSAVTAYWNDTLGAVRVKTPDRSMDILLNRWLLYQTIACRVWARSAFYQASGAYGFRDQLQDGMAIIVTKPELTREHLLRAAGRQFVEGDLQHWWLPESGRGVRTRISDDAVWLPFAVAHYVRVTNDRTVLDERVPFIEGALLRPGEHDSFFQPMVSGEDATVFEHCALALDRSLVSGVHGLPLMGTGDWNDGMNRVGEEGKGESVWLGWFLHAALTQFAPIAALRGEHLRAEAWLDHAVALRASLEHQAWDGAWYLRGYYDDGARLGSASSDECRIDSIAQSWSVISGAGDPAHAAQAMASVNEHLVRRRDGQVLLFTPPFDRTLKEPGYIKGYPPGIRENGGQYTHGAVWTAIAFAMMGDGDKASEVFSMLNPINHSNTRSALHRYKVEPYAVCADVYSQAPHAGRGGWTWYTGSAGWMYRAGVEWILGLRIEGAMLVIDPCIPKAWPRFEMTYRYRTARYTITVENPNGVSRGVASCAIDGAVSRSVAAGSAARISMADDGLTHEVRIILGTAK